MEPARKMSYAEYVEASPEWEIRHEWVNGDLLAMSGGTMRHAAISANIIGEFLTGLRGRPCRPFSSDQRVHVSATESSFYPDVTVACPPFRAADGDPNALIEPVVIVEVLSPSTRNYDLSEKFEHYRHLPSLQHYLAIEPERRHVLHLSRKDDGWFRRDLEEGEVLLTGLDIALSLDAIYADLPEPPEI